MNKFSMWSLKIIAFLAIMIFMIIVQLCVYQYLLIIPNESEAITVKKIAALIIIAGSTLSSISISLLIHKRLR